jgi:hypothetical protein
MQGTTAMHIESSIRDFADGMGRLWLAWQAVAVNGSRNAVPWVTFIQPTTGERVSGRTSRTVMEMDENDLTRLLESLREAEV